MLQRGNKCRCIQNIQQQTIFSWSLSNKKNIQKVKYFYSSTKGEEEEQGEMREPKLLSSSHTVETGGWMQQLCITIFHHSMPCLDVKLRSLPLMVFVWSLLNYLNVAFRYPFKLEPESQRGCNAMNVPLRVTFLCNMLSGELEGDKEFQINFIHVGDFQAVVWRISQKSSFLKSNFQLLEEQISFSRF